MPPRRLANGHDPRVSATGIGSTLRDHRGTPEKIAGAIIVALGLLFIASLSSLGLLGGRPRA